MNILVVDDDTVFLDRMSRILSSDHHIITTAVSGTEALAKLDGEEFDLIFTDLKMPGISGVEFIQKLKDRRINSLIIMITGYGTINSAVESMKVGAYDYILKPFNIQVLKDKIKDAETEIRLRKEYNLSKVANRSKFGDLDEFNNINGYESPFLIISNEDPNIIIKKLNLKNYIKIWLDYQEGNDSVAPSKLNSLKSRIEKFISENNKGTVIFKGIEDVITLHNWDVIKKFINYLRSDVMSQNFPLILLIDEKGTSLDELTQELLQDSLTILLNPSFSNIINLLSHPLRRKIIQIIKEEKRINFNKILKKINIQNSSLLAFHMNKLSQEFIFEKLENDYSLSPRGLYLAELIPVFENLCFADPYSKIKLYKIN
ncbi:MAG: response regulator [Candidatus Helarchaeota archaeon]